MSRVAPRQARLPRHALRQRRARAARHARVPARAHRATARDHGEARAMNYVGATTPTVNFGVVLHHLGQYHKLVHVLATSPLVASNDFTYAAPIYKGSDKIKAALA